MTGFVLRRLMILPFMLIGVSIIVFIVISLPPGNYVENYITRMEMQGTTFSDAQIEQMEERYGLDQPLYQQYLKWVGNIVLRGDFGKSFIEQRSVILVVKERIPVTMLISFTTMIFTFAVGIIVGTYSATHQYSIGDYIAVIFGFIGRATPNFMLALILLWVFYEYFGFSVSGLLSDQYSGAPLSLGKVIDFAKHLIVPIIVIGTAGTAGAIRTTRAQMLDEITKPYVVTAEAKGVPPVKRLMKYPLRIALIPAASTAGWRLPRLISGATIVSVVLNLRTTGPILLSALRNEDLFLAASLLLFLSFLTIIGTLISDIILAWVDPRIRYRQ